jgi:DNA-binding GntR family transcriptional regulator
MLNTSALMGTARVDDDHRLYDATGKPLQVGGVPPSFPEHVRRLLERQIIAGSLRPGQRVTEDDLARSIGVSRTPVREAMRGLEAQGLITRWRGRGAFVARRMTAEEASALYQVRESLESHLTSRAAERVTASELATLETLESEFREAAAGNETGKELRHLIVIDSDFHWTIYHSADSELVSVLASYWGRLQCELYDRVYTGGQPDLFGDQHERIVGALRRQNRDEARAAMAKHIRTGWDVVESSFRAEADATGGPTI